MSEVNQVTQAEERESWWQLATLRVWATLLILCPPLVVWAQAWEGHDAWRQVARALELTQRRTGAVFLALLAGLVAYLVWGDTMLGWIALVLTGMGAGWVMSRPYRRTIMAVRRGEAPVAAIREAEAVARAAADAEARAR